MSERPGVRAVVDTNVFVSGLILQRGNPYRVLEAWRRGQFRLLMNDAQGAELREVLRRPKFATKYGLGEPEIQATLDLIQASATRVADGPPPATEVRDPDDVMLLTAARVGQADYLVTGDEDLHALRGDERLDELKIVTPREFLALLAADQAVGDDR